jgi:hypothetical protein
MTTTPNIPEVDAKEWSYNADKNILRPPFGTTTAGETNYDKPVTVPELAHDAHRSASASAAGRWSPSPSPGPGAAGPWPQQSPLSAYTELTAVVPCEIHSIAATDRQPHGSPEPPHQIAAEMQHPSPLGAAAAAVYDVHELSSSPYWPSAAHELVARPTGPEMTDGNARELS